MKIFKDNFNFLSIKFLLFFLMFCISVVKINNFYVERQRDRTFFTLISALRSSNKTELKSICTDVMYRNIENFVKDGAFSGCSIYEETPSAMRKSSWLVWKNWAGKFDLDDITGWELTDDPGVYSPTYSSPQSAEFRLSRIGYHWKVVYVITEAR